jgi:HPt (histidine-containing phosphotransfer) domain-containing protein
MHEMILLFIKSTESAVDRIQNAIQDEDLKRVFENAHKIAASCKQIGAIHLHNLIKQLEEKAKTDEGSESVISVFQSVKAEITVVNSFLKLYLEENGT